MARVMLFIFVLTLVGRLIVMAVRERQGEE